MTETPGREFCAHCGKPMAADARFCAACGMAIEPTGPRDVKSRVLNTWSRGAKVGLIVVVALVGLGVIRHLVGRLTNPRTPEEKKMLDDRFEFAERSEVCQTLQKFGGECHYVEDDPNALTVYIDRVKPQFRRRVVSDMLSTNDLVPALRKAGFRKLRIRVSGGDFDESYDLTTDPVSKMEGDYEP
jgi:hypothetical protein